MAQRLIHQLFAQMLAEADGGSVITDTAAFTFGSLLPDAYRAEDAVGDVRRDAQVLTHYKRATPDMLFRYFDFAGFYHDHKREIMSDDMYLGYYIHIVEDACYRYFSHAEKGIPRAAVPEMVAVIHRDYHLLNRYIMENYRLAQDVAKPDGFENNAVNLIYPFDADRMLCELKGDYNDETQGEAVYLTGDMLDEFVDRYLPRCLEIMRSARRGEAPPDPLDCKWSAGDRKDYL